MISRIYFSLTFLLTLTFLWAVQAQTAGHVYTYVAICLSAAISLKTILPYVWVFVTLLLAWWGLSLNWAPAAVCVLPYQLLHLCFGRNVF